MGFRVMIIVQCGLLIADAALSLFAEEPRHTFFIVIACYVLQFLCLGLNVVLLFVRFTHTYPFRAGMITVVASEFKWPIATAALHALMLLIGRGVGATVVSSCEQSKCDFWTPSFVAVMTLYRTSSVIYYVGFERAMIQLCDPKFYEDSEWFRNTVH